MRWFCHAVRTSGDAIVGPVNQWLLGKIWGARWNPGDRAGRAADRGAAVATQVGRMRQWHVMGRVRSGGLWLDCLTN